MQISILFLVIIMFIMSSDFFPTELLNVLFTAALRAFLWNQRLLTSIQHPIPEF